jgi:hypothetical protein
MAAFRMHRTPHRADKIFFSPLDILFKKLQLPDAYLSNLVAGM